MKSTTSWFATSAFTALLAIFAIPRAAAAETPGESGALFVNIPERDLNQLLRNEFHARGGPRLEGTRATAGQGLRDLHYQVDLSEPVVKIGAQGRITLSLAIEQADLKVEHLERKIGGRLASCQDAGLTVDSAGPVTVALGLQLRIRNGDLRIVPLDVSVSHPENIHLVKPSRCTHAPLPTWLLWLLGKARLKHEIRNLDEILLASATKSTSKLGREEPLLTRHWQIASRFDPQSKADMYLYLSALETDHGSLFMSLARSSTPPVRSATHRRDPRPPQQAGTISPESIHAAPRTQQEAQQKPAGSAVPPAEPAPSSAPDPRPLSFDRAALPQDHPSVAISSVFFNEILAATFSGGADMPRKAHGDFSRLLKSSSIYALIPGIHGIESRQNVSFSFAFRAPPRVEFRPLAAAAGETPPLVTAPGSARPPIARAEIQIRFTGIEMKLWQKTGKGPALLGTLLVDSGSVGVVPVMNSLGGISFKIVENDWRVSSSGVEFDDALFAATLQELVFAEVFGTMHEPLLRDGLRVGSTRLVPQAFNVMGDYLVVALALLPAGPAPGLQAAPEQPARTSRLDPGRRDSERNEPLSAP